MKLKWLIILSLVVAAVLVVVSQVGWGELAKARPVLQSESNALPAAAGYPAPELQNGVWINSQPLRLQDLRGKVVLLDMWTLGCINCRNVIPSLRAWHEQYQDQGLVVIGNHYPEFAYERDLGTLKQAVNDLQITYAVAQDNSGEAWAAYNVRYWPTLFLIDKQGNVRYQYIGEGWYKETEEMILKLLAE